MIKATAVVLAWNGRRWIGPCLDSLLASDYPGLEVLVVDNASTDGTTDLTARYIPRVRLVRNRRNLGYAGGNNVGVRAALEGGAEMVALVNQDTRVEPDWLTRIVEAARADPRLGILSPSQWDYDGVAPDPSFLAVLAAADPRAAQAVAAGRAVAGAVLVETAIGAALVLRRSLIERVGRRLHVVVEAQHEVRARIEQTVRRRAPAERAEVLPAPLEHEPRPSLALHLPVQLPDQTLRVVARAVVEHDHLEAALGILGPPQAVEAGDQLAAVVPDGDQHRDRRVRVTHGAPPRSSRAETRALACTGAVWPRGCGAAPRASAGRAAAPARSRSLSQ